MVKARSSSLLGKITLLIVICCLVMGSFVVNTAAALPGSGTQQDPYRIESLADFDEFAVDPNYWSGFTRLETDVNLTGRTYTTAVIAPDVNNDNYEEFDGTAFTGVFDGNDHKLINLTIDGDYNDHVGLFGCIGEDGEVSNLGLEGGSVSGCPDVGGLVGYNSGSISNCYFNGSVSGDWSVGGLVGENGGSISNCYSTASVRGIDDIVGGLLGENFGSISNCYSCGDVEGRMTVGGLVGENGGSISNCYSCGDVEGRMTVGGLVGYNWGRLLNCYSTGDVNGYSGVGGLVGANGDWDHPSAILNCYSSGDVNGGRAVAGLVGRNYGSISNCYSTGDVIGDRPVGGLVGYNGASHPGPPPGPTIEADDLRPGCIFNSYSIGNVQGTWGVGGLVGTHDYGSISNCYSIGDVNGDDFVGGFVGGNWATILNCYSAGDVNGDDYVGGLVGGNSATILNCYSTGDVSGLYIYGGLLGENGGSVLNCFWDTDTQTHGVTESIGLNEGNVTNVSGLTTTEMQTRITLIDAGWDFIEIWLINDWVTYPILRQEIRSDLNGDGSVNLLDFAFFADHWLEDKTTLLPLPGQASNPNPANYALCVDPNTDLFWTAGSHTSSHNVYFGSANPPAFKGNQAESIFDPGTMDYSTTYYWRIDEVNPIGITTGTVWTFTTYGEPPPPLP